MKNYSMIFMLCLPLIIGFWGCEKPVEMVNRDAELKEIAQVVDSCIGWFKTKDFELSFSTVANDEKYLSVHPSDRMVRGFEQFKKNSEIFKHPEFLYVHHELKDLVINLSNSADVAWFYCILNDINTYKGEQANWENTRWTGVLEKRDGRWVIVQQHFSFPKS